MNTFCAVGRLATDVEARTTAKGTALASFRVAIPRRYKREGQPDADFFRVTAWGKQAEVINQYFSKGKQIAFTGRIEINKYTDKSGIEHSTPDITLETFDFIGPKDETATQVPLAIDDDFSLLAEGEDLPF